MYIFNILSLNFKEYRSAYSMNTFEGGITFRALLAVRMNLILIDCLESIQSKLLFSSQPGHQPQKQNKDSRRLMAISFNPFSTRPHQTAFWYNNPWLTFLKLLNYVPKRRFKKSCKKRALICQLHVKVAMAHRIYFRRNNLCRRQILKLATYTKIEDHYFRCKLATF